MCGTSNTYARSEISYDILTRKSDGKRSCGILFPLPEQPNASQGLRLIFEASRSHSDTPQSVGLLWTGDRPVKETSTWQRMIFTRDRHPCQQWDSNPQSQQANGRRPSPLDRSATGARCLWVKINTYQALNWIQLARDYVRWPGPVNSVIKFRFA